MKQPLKHALITSKPATAQKSSAKREPFRPREGWMVYKINRQVDQCIILTRFVALVDALPAPDVWAHYRTGNPGTSPRLILKLLAVKFLFQLSAARALGMAELLRNALHIPADVVFPHENTLHYRLRSGIFDHMLDRLLTLSLEHAVDDTAALDSTGFATPRALNAASGAPTARNTPKAG